MRALTKGLIAAVVVGVGVALSKSAKAEDGGEDSWEPDDGYERPTPNPAPTELEGTWKGLRYHVFSKSQPGFARRYAFEVQVSTDPSTWRFPHWPEFPYTTVEAAADAAEKYIDTL